MFDNKKFIVLKILFKLVIVIFNLFFVNLLDINLLNCYNFLFVIILYMGSFLVLFNFCIVINLVRYCFYFLLKLFFFVLIIMIIGKFKMVLFNFDFVENK